MKPSILRRLSRRSLTVVTLGGWWWAQPAKSSPASARPPVQAAETSRVTALQVCGQLKVLAARPLAIGPEKRLRIPAASALKRISIN